MRLLNYFLNLFSTKKSSFIFKSEQEEKENVSWRKYNSENSIYFKVPGAGDICMSKSCHTHTGSACGFSFGVEWGRHGFSGGVLGRNEAKRMAEFILQKCSEVKETEEEELIRYDIEWKKRMDDMINSSAAAGCSAKNNGA